jgi:hypothetical protein
VIRIASLVDEGEPNLTILWMGPRLSRPLVTGERRLLTLRPGTPSPMVCFFIK